MKMSNDTKKVHKKIFTSVRRRQNLKTYKKHLRETSILQFFLLFIRIYFFIFL